MSLAAKFPLHSREEGSSERKLAEVHQDISMTCLDDIPSQSICDDQVPMDIHHLNERPLENLENHSYHLLNSLGSTRIESEDAMVLDVDGCIPKHLPVISTAFHENAPNECRNLPYVLSESVAFSNINNHYVDTMDSEKEAVTCSLSEFKAHIKEKSTSTAKKANSIGEVQIDWDGMRRKVIHDDGKKERSYESLDSINWEAVRNADVNKISEAIRERGMNNLLAERIKVTFFFA